MSEQIEQLKGKLETNWLDCTCGTLTPPPLPLLSVSTKFSLSLCFISLTQVAFIVFLLSYIKFSRFFFIFLLLAWIFCTHTTETPKQRPISCQAYTSKLPKMGQSDLDFLAPEVQTQSVYTPMSDMFSMGLLIVFIYNKGRPLISASLNPANYIRQLDMVSA